MTGKEYIISELEKIEKSEESELMASRCPHDIGLENIENCGGTDCLECWKQALESEVE